MGLGGSARLWPSFRLLATRSSPSAITRLSTVSLTIDDDTDPGNGTLYDDLDIVVASVNASLARFGEGPIDAVEYAADAGARIVAVTDSAVSPTARVARHTIIARNESASFYHSFTGALAVTQALITLLVAKKGGDAVMIAREAEKQLSKISAYW